MNRYAMMCSAALLGLSASPGFAQTASSSTATAAPDPAETQAAHADQIEDIVVTAERRQDTVQRTSLSIEVFSGPVADKVTSVQAITALSPGVQVASSGAQPQVYIRGVGDVAPNSRTQSAVAFNIDGVYIARGTQVTPSLFDISRIEVLKGPQGTLYGRNASGGAVNLITNRPKLGEYGGYVGGTLANFDDKEFTAALNVPVGDTAALRLAGQVIDRDGYISDGGLDQKTKAVRGRFLWEPTNSTSILLNADYLHIGGQGSGRVIKPEADGNPWRGTLEAPYLYPFQLGSNTLPLTAPTDRFIDSNSYGFSAEVNVDLGFATLTVIPAYRYQDQEVATYTTNFRVFEGLKDKEATLEARLGNDDGRLKWVVGGYLFRESQDVELNPSMNNRSAVAFSTTVKAAAVFGQGTVSVTDRLRLIGGARYTQETTDGEYVQGTGLRPYEAFTPTSAVVPISLKPVDAFNYKVGAEFDLAPHSMLFGTYSTGFKGGGFSQTVTCGADEYGPEKLNALTLGLRNRFLDNRLQVNAEGFRWKYKDQQISFTGVDNCGGVTQLIRNPGDATIQGANIDAIFRLTSNDTVRGSVEFNDATYDTYDLTQFGIGQFGPTSGTLCTPTRLADPRFYSIDCSGQQVPRTPRWAGTAGYSHVFELSGDSNLTFATDAQFASARWLDNSYLPNGRAAGYAVFNAQLTFSAPAKAWSVTAFVDNITNEAVYTGGSQIGFNAPNGFRYYTATIQPPRFYGVRAKVNF